MIISVSRRTDIPAFYSKWFFKRLEEGYVYSRNPMNHSQVSEISLSKDVVDCFVFWTKDPGPMLDQLKKLDGYPYYFHVTINPYEEDLERAMRKKRDIIRTTVELSKKIGKDRVIWRYNPIIITDKYDLDYHKKYFEIFARKLSPYVNKCVISFLEEYAKTKRNMSGINYKSITDDDRRMIGKAFSDIGKSLGLSVETCSETIDLSEYGIEKTKCIDDRLISKITGVDISVDKDNNQREVCGCVKSIDIGAYNSCPHDCLYCYANTSEKSMKKNIRGHRWDSPFLIGELRPDDKIYKRDMLKYNKGQIKLDL